jgi:hypothetical protein
MQTQGRTNRRVFQSVTMTLVVLATACGAQKQTSDFKHDLNHPTNNDVASQWQSLSDDDIQDVIRPIYETFLQGRVQLLDKSDEVVLRLQYWVDAIHQTLLNAHPDEMKDVVKPKAQVIVTEDPNAFVMPVPVCYDVTVVMDESARQSEENTAEGVVIQANGELTQPISTSTCVDGGSDEEFFKTFVKDFNNHDHKCQLKLDSSNDGIVIVANKDCRRDDAMAPFAAAKKLVRQPVAGIITFFSGIITMMTEEELVSVVAHELGHYYKVHSDHPNDSTYNFFYTLKQANPSAMPKAERSLNEAGQAAIAAAEIPNARYVKVAGQKFRSEFYGPLRMIGRLVNRLQTCPTDDGAEEDLAPKCNTVCKSFDEYSFSAAFREAMGPFPFAKLSAEGKEAYKTFEDKAQACLELLSVGTEKVKEGLEIADDKVAAALMIDRDLAAMFAGTEVAGKLEDVFASATLSLESAEIKLVEPLREAARRAIGYYTAEQEADELAAEWLADIGLSPEASIQSEFRLGEYVHALRTQAGVPQHPTEMNIEDCKKLYANQWRDESGKYVIIPIGDYADTHHSSCFRAFNADREIKAHNLKVASVRHEKLPGGSWSEIRKTVQKLHEKKNNDALRSLFEIFFPSDEEVKSNHVAQTISEHNGACKFFGNHAH